jgi:hypothetical protein
MSGTTHGSYAEPADPSQLPQLLASLRDDAQPTLPVPAVAHLLERGGACVVTDETRRLVALAVERFTYETLRDARTRCELRAGGDAGGGGGDNDDDAAGDAAVSASGSGRRRKRRRLVLTTHDLVGALKERRIDVERPAYLQNDNELK